MKTTKWCDDCGGGGDNDEVWWRRWNGGGDCGCGGKVALKARVGTRAVVIVIMYFLKLKTKFTKYFLLVLIINVKLF